MRKITKYFIVLTGLLFAISCKKDEYKAPVSNTVSMSGRWWIQFWIDDDGNGAFDPAVDLLYYDYADIGGVGVSTSNDAANSPDSLWVNDIEGIWPFKFKSGVNTSTNLFSPATYNNLAIDGESVTVHEAKILPGAGTTLSGSKVDSIYFDLEFSDDPGYHYFFSGIKYTGHVEDEYH